MAKGKAGFVRKSPGVSARIVLPGPGRISPLASLKAQHNCLAIANFVTREKFLQTTFGKLSPLLLPFREEETNEK
jgi:hypothetical protein